MTLPGWDARGWRVWGSAALGLVLLTGCMEEPWEPDLQTLEDLSGLAGLSPRVSDASNALLGAPGAVALGERLFHDKGLSSCGTVSCESCHAAATGYTVPTPTATGCGGTTARNPPTLLNAARAEWFMWDGLADTLWSQALLPLTNPVEMGATPQSARAHLEAGYAEEWAAVFGKPLAEMNDAQVMAGVGKVLAAYEATLLTEDTTFDASVRRFVAAANAGAARQDPDYEGFRVFAQKGRCITCHKGTTLSDGRFHNVGVADESPMAEGRLLAIEQMLDSEFNARGPYSDAPEGHPLHNRLVNLASELEQERQADSLEFRTEFRGAYKTPTLRAISRTAPYMHTGRYATLREVVELYNKGGEPKGSYPGEVNPDSIAPLELTEAEMDALVRLLEQM